jgi:hypothetical protein
MLGGPDEQYFPNALFKTLDLHADCRRRSVNLSGSTGETAVFCDRHKAFKHVIVE